VARLVIVAGPPGGGKTTEAVMRAAELDAVRLSPDDWMVAAGIDMWDSSARETIEHAQLLLMSPLLRSGRSVVVEWGTWMSDERAVLRGVAAAAGAEVELRWCSADLDELMRRIEARPVPACQSRLITREDMEAWLDEVEAPDADELALYDEAVLVRG
jgi:predicted kinase